jgi:hypothetical protein
MTTTPTPEKTTAIATEAAVLMPSDSVICEEYSELRLGVVDLQKMTFVNE